MAVQVKIYVNYNFFCFRICSRMSQEPQTGELSSTYPEKNTWLKGSSTGRGRGHWEASDRAVWWDGWQRGDGGGVGGEVPHGAVLAVHQRTEVISQQSFTWSSYIASRVKTSSQSVVCGNTAKQQVLLLLFSWIANTSQPVLSCA